jgi:hypothetical protein
MRDPDTGTEDKNLSTERQEEGDARRPSDTLDRDQTPAPGNGEEEKIGRG